MSIPKHLTLSYQFAKKQKRIITPVYLYPVQPNGTKAVTTDALWDTGASMSAITPEIKDRLKLIPIDRRVITGVHNTLEVDVVLVTLELPNNVIKKNIEAVVCNIGSSIGMILGMDIILLGDFAISNGNEQTLVSFAVPPFHDKIDFTTRQNDP